MPIRKEFEKEVAKLALEACDSLDQQKNDQYREDLAYIIEACMRDVDVLLAAVAGDKNLEEQAARLKCYLENLKKFYL